jgi:enamine deaminase RidA (YjgF/YER057c/UK114 family)
MYSHGMVAPAGDLVVVAGQVAGRRPDDAGVPDVVAQTRRAFENVRAVLEAAGCTMADVVRFQTFLTGAELIPGFMRARQDVFAEYYPNRVYPPNTLLVVSRLVQPELLVEIEAMAVRPRRPASRKRAPAKRPAAKRRRR